MAIPFEQIPEHLLHLTHVALSKAGGDETHAEWIRTGDNAAEIIRFIDEQRGRRIKSRGSILIDCDVAPHVPQGWEIRQTDQLPGAVGGQIELDVAKMILHLDDGQKDGRTIVGNELKEKLAGKRLLKANVIDRLKASAGLIPDEWKCDDQGRPIIGIYFWGTLYRTDYGDLRVRCLYWDNGEWRWGNSVIERAFNDLSPAAILAP